VRRATLGSTAFFLVAPGVVAGLVPWAITRWAGSPPGVGVLDVAGCLLVAAGVGVVVACFAQFVREGHGTPAPVAPPDTLVVGGLYRHVRNPMYLGVGAVIAGQVLAFRSVQLTVWLVGFAIAVTTFVVLYEQPTLSRQFGASYDHYRREVPAWWPRLRPWQ
jgi:protein-S-isoprenylcysteine O-methyltransferase Ste14